jgi:asparagine synthase (glutamine-hydrolysing)
MCGLAGIYTAGGLDRDAGEHLRRMTERIRHRGPDDEGWWLDPEAGIGLGSRRLAIIDLSPLGHQPMCSADGRWVIAYNGEIYNFADVRRELEAEGQGFRGHSDTEVLVEAVARWGLVPAIRRCAGMFAFALWDRAERALHLVRDRLGEKPLYYARMGGVLLFGSELKALREHPRWRGEIDRDAVALLLRHGYIPAPHTIYRDAFKLPPATILTVRAGVPDRLTEYWDLRAVAEEGVRSPRADEPEAVAEEFEALLRRTVGREMVADVPLGAFLSGGIDSSTIVALMQAQSSRPVRTFTIGFRESEYDEAAHARAVARHLGTDHTELYVSPEEARATIPELPAVWDEPFADASEIPTLLLSRLARRHVTVSLSGDGGDELLGGYERYHWGGRLWRKLSRIPHAVRATAAGVVHGIPVRAWNAAAGLGAPLLPARLHPPSFGAKLHTVGDLLRARDEDDLYVRQMSFWGEEDEVVVGARPPRTGLTDRQRWPRFGDPIARAMYVDARTYLPDDILVKVDRASMAASLETRAPLLDHEVVEFVWRVPMAQKVDGGRGKALLRRVLARHVPPALTERPKMGFGVPLDAWLRGPLRGWAEELLERGRMRSDGVLDPAEVGQLWARHLNGQEDLQYALWPVLMFQAWARA